MQSVSVQYNEAEQMTLPPSPIARFQSPLPPLPPDNQQSVKLPSPLASHPSLRNQNPLQRKHSQESGTIPVRHRLRLSKILSKESFRERRLQQNCDDDDGRGDIRVLSPSLVNSQVLSKTRPLSPANHGQQDENDATVLKMVVKDAGGKKKHDGKIICKGGEEMFEADGKEADKEGAKTRGRGRRRPRLFKLKFHHQALPPEYLDHYEASLRQERIESTYDTKDVRETLEMPPDIRGKGLQAGPRQGNKGKTGRVQRGARPITIHQAGGGATEALLRDLLLSNPQIQQAALQQAAIARAQSVPSIMLASVGQMPRVQFPSPLPLPSSDENAFGEDQSSYASDMSVDECPKRNRKSKRNGIKRHIGRLLDGVGLGTNGYMEKSSSQMVVDEAATGALATQYVNLEKEALARSRSYTSLIPSHYDQSEPLNLCIRDKSLNYSESLTPGTPEMCQTSIKTEPTLATDDLNKEAELKKDFEEYTPKTPCSPPEYPTWSFGGACMGGGPHWLHDYRLKTEDGFSSGQSTPSLCSQSSHLPCSSPPTWPHFSPPPHSPSPAPPLSPLHPSANPRHIQALLKESLQNRLEEAARERLNPREVLMSSPSRPNRATPHLPSGRESKTGARRKRSALFIPPADPSTEVSICKFKFTGGANPILEEKKMVSVDAGGTLRYFSGGDRVASREHRHTAPNLRLSGKILENLSKCEKDVKKIRLESDTEDTCSLPGGGQEATCSSVTTSPTATLEYGAQSPMQFPAPIEDSPKRKRRSKKSSVREKLEQTLREKGLLIQTQQVESAEGATYCKFRQLRKITRYLFRSWKDYLPGQLHEGMPGDPTINDQRPPSGYCHRSSPRDARIDSHINYPSTN